MTNQQKLPTTTSPTKDEFDQLAELWQRETRGQDVHEMVRHPAYRKIVQMDEVAIGWILESLQKEIHHWFPALHEITGATPVPPESRGRIPEMTKAWLDWGREQGHIS